MRGLRCDIKQGLPAGSKIEVSKGAPGFGCRSCRAQGKLFQGGFSKAGRR